MAETLASYEGSEIERIDLDSVRSRLKELSEMRIDPLDSCVTSASESMKSLEDFALDFQERIKQIELEDLNIASLGLEDLEAYSDQLKKELYAAEDENTKFSSEIGALTRNVAEDSAQLDGDLEELACSLRLIDSQGLHSFQAGIANGRLSSGDIHESLMHVSEDYKFEEVAVKEENKLRENGLKKGGKVQKEILDLDQRFEKSKINLSTLQDLDYDLRRVELVGQIEDMLSEVKVIEFEDNCIRLSLKTPIPTSDGLFLRHKLDCVIEPSVLNHELLIEVVDRNMELKSVEIFPCDISLDEVVDVVKSSRQFVSSLSNPMITGSSLGWLVRQVQLRIILCTLRRLLVKDANKSRHSFEYSDKDETITAHLVGGIDAFIKISPGWPVSSSALKLASIRKSDMNSKSISLSFLCKVKELANSLNTQTRQHLPRFMDAIEEILMREMNSELHSNNISA